MQPHELVCYNFGCMFVNPKSNAIVRKLHGARSEPKTGATINIGLLQETWGSNNEV